MARVQDSRNPQPAAQRHSPHLTPELLPAAPPRRALSVGATGTQWCGGRFIARGSDKPPGCLSCTSFAVWPGGSGVTRLTLLVHPIAAPANDAPRCSVLCAVCAWCSLKSQMGATVMVGVGPRLPAGWSTLAQPCPVRGPEHRSQGTWKPGWERAVSTPLAFPQHLLSLPCVPVAPNNGTVPIT